MGGARLLLERHPPERHRGGRRPGRGVVVEPPRDRRRRARDRRDRLAPRRSRRWPATRPPAACRSRSPPTTSSRARTSCSTRTTGTWAACTARSTGPTCCRGASAPSMAAELTPRRSAGRHAPRGRARAARRGVRRHAPRASAPRCASCAERLARDPDACALAGRTSAAPRPRRARQAARRVPRRRSSPAPTQCFFGADRSYHEARRRFVYKLGAPCAVTPATAPVAFPAAVAQA